MSAPSKSTADQPQAATEMKIVGQSQAGSKQEQHAHCEHQAGHKAWRMRGGGAAKDCFLGAIGCFLCFECCEGCCDCCGDILCCPCEMIC